MKKPLRKIIFTLSLFSLFLLGGIATADAVYCDSTEGKSLNQLASETGDSTIIMEITEPLGSFDQKITSGGIDVSAVYWKFTCKATSSTGSTTDKTTETYYRAYSKGCPVDATCTLVQIIRGTSGTGILKTYIAVIYRWAAGIVGIIAVLVIVISGIQISMDQGGGESIGAAKTRIMQSLSGLVVLFLSALILYTINPTFFQK
ncbi:MAG: hypothetical protein WC882_05245 [Candidatus Gracilibacteria bacterium]